MAFPALRFVRESNRATKGLMRLKQILLLALRVAVLAVFVLILARPLSREHVVASSDLAEKIPAAVVFCFDNSPSMGYRHLGYTRLEAARQLARRLAEELPAQSRAAVLDLTTSGQVRSLERDLGGLGERIERVAPCFLAGSLQGIVQTAEALLAEAQEERREIYLFTDMTASAWRGIAQGTFARYERVPVYVLDVGAQENLNFALDLPRLSAQRAAQNETIQIGADVVAGDRPGKCTVALEIEGTLRGRAAAELKQPQDVRWITFDEPVVETELMQGRLTLLESDALEVDNSRYFTIRVGRVPRVAVVGSETVLGPGGTGWLVFEALAPQGLRARGQAVVEPVRVPVAQLGRRSLREFEAVYLADAAGVSAAGWSALEQFVGEGGGLIVVLGDAAAAELASSASTYRSAAAKMVLGTDLATPKELSRGARLAEVKYGDSALTAFDRGQNGDLRLPVIYRFVPLSPLGSARPVLTLESGGVLLTANGYKSGNAFVLATAPQRAWSNLAGHAEFVILMHSLLGAARHQYDEARGLALGEPITFRFSNECMGQTALLTGPGLPAAESRTINPTVATATFGPLFLPGNYRIQVTAPDRVRLFGFSLNVDPAESRFERVSAGDIEACFAPGMVHVARDLPGLKRAEKLVYRGREMTAWLLPALMAFLVAELMLANRYYRRPAAESAGT